MKFRILSGDTIIGESDFTGLDPSMGVALGVFVPSPDYKNVQPVFRLYVEAEAGRTDLDEARFEEYYRARDALDLSVINAAGERVPNTCVHITDFSEDLGEMEVTVYVADSPTFERYFESGR